MDHIIAKLLQYSFPNELNEKSYAEIEDVIDNTKGKTRLFVTQGKKDGLTSKKLVEFIKNKCKIQGFKIRDIEILDKFSFITLPFHDAEILLTYFKKKKRSSEPFITKAKKAK